MLIIRRHKIQGWNDVISKIKIFQLWNEYIGEHFHCKRVQPAIFRNIERLEILKSEVEEAQAKLNRNKGAG